MLKEISCVRYQTSNSITWMSSVIDSDTTPTNLVLVSLSDMAKDSEECQSMKKTMDFEGIV